MMKTLLLGYGNVDRQDDGVAWHILRAVAEHYQVRLPAWPEETLYGITPDISGCFTLQLTPEIAELITTYPRVIFIDAHTGNIDQPVAMVEIQPAFQSSPFTHHLTPQTCLALAQSLFGSAPQAFLVSVRGYEFGFSRDLSPTTAKLAATAADEIVEQLDQ